MRISRTRMQTFAKSSVFSEGSKWREIPPPARRENPEMSIFLLTLVVKSQIKTFHFLSNHEGGYLTLSPAALENIKNLVWVGKDM